MKSGKLFASLVGVLVGLVEVAILLAILLGASGCSTRVEVQSDTAWTKTVNGSRTYGEGNASYNVSSSRAVFDFQKDTDGGYLRARAVRGTHADDWQETRAPRGSVRVVVR